MKNIVIISPSIRKGRYSHRVALYFEKLVRENNLAGVEILDLLELNFPLFNERLKYQEKPLKEAVDFAVKIKKADGVLIISPEYNGASPASLKNAIDLLVDEWVRKPVAFATVSDGNFAGTQAIISLQYTLSKLGAMIIPSVMRFPNINKTFDINGVPSEMDKTGLRAKNLIIDLLWYIEAKQRMS